MTKTPVVELVEAAGRSSGVEPVETPVVETPVVETPVVEFVETAGRPSGVVLVETQVVETPVVELVEAAGRSSGVGPVETPTVGVLALQGGVREHVDLLRALGVRTAELRQPRDLIGPDGWRVDAIVLPGGESSTIDRLLRVFGLFEPLREAIAAGLPTLGTCAGLVLLAEEVIDPAPGQQSLCLLDVTVRRNAFGSQVESAEVDLPTTLGPAHVAFIRAPGVERVGAGVDVLATHQGAIVAVRQGSIIGVSFHPELTGDTLFHQELLRGVTSARSRPGADD